MSRKRPDNRFLSLVYGMAAASSSNFNSTCVSDVEHDQNETFIHMKYTIHPHRSSISLQKNGLLCFLTLPARESSSRSRSAFSNSKLAFHVRQANAPRPSQDVGSPDLQSCFRILQVSFQLCVLISQRDQLYVGSCCSAHLQI